MISLFALTMLRVNRQLKRALLYSCGRGLCLRTTFSRRKELAVSYLEEICLVSSWSDRQAQGSQAVVSAHDVCSMERSHRQVHHMVPHLRRFPRLDRSGHDVAVLHPPRSGHCGLRGHRLDLAGAGHPVSNQKAAHFSTIIHQFLWLNCSVVLYVYYLT